MSGSLFFLLQWCDTLFPTGAFSHSFGLESAVQRGAVRDGETLRPWIRAKLVHTVIPCDGVLLCQAYRAAARGDLASVARISAEGFAMRLPAEFREGGKMIAARWLQSAAELYPSPWTSACLESARSGRIKGDPAVAFGLSGFGAGASLEETLLGYLYMIVSGQVSAAIRLLSIGQREGQRIIRELLVQIDREGEISEILADAARRPSSFAPALEIGGMRHERSEVRLFQS